MILLEKKDHSAVVSRCRQMFEHPSRFPPPVMLRLRKFSFPIVAVQVRMFGVGTF